MDGIKFSFIMPTYNRSIYFPKAVMAVVNQTYDNWELIIVDDCSEIEEYEKKKRFIESLNRNNIKMFRLNENSGHCYARNYGVVNSVGEWIVYSDDDNQTDKDCCRNLLSVIKEKTEVITAKYFIVHDSGHMETKGLDCSQKNIFVSNQVDTCSFAHHRDCFEKYGKWDCSYLRMADDEIIFRYVSNCQCYSFCDKPIAYFYDRVDLIRVMNKVDALPYMRKLYYEFRQLYKGKCIVIHDDFNKINNSYFDIINFIDFDIYKNKSSNIELLRKFSKDYEYIIIVNNFYNEALNDLFKGLKRDAYYEINHNVAFSTRKAESLKKILKLR